MPKDGKGDRVPETTIRWLLSFKINSTISISDVKCIDSCLQKVYINQMEIFYETIR